MSICLWDFGLYSKLQAASEPIDRMAKTDLKAILSINLFTVLNILTFTFTKVSNFQHSVNQLTKKYYKHVHLTWRILWKKAALSATVK